MSVDSEDTHAIFFPAPLPFGEAIAAASLSLAGLLVAGQAGAAPTAMDACNKKHATCSERCRTNNKTADKQGACVSHAGSLSEVPKSPL